MTMSSDQIRAFLDDLGQLTARHGVAVEYPRWDLRLRPLPDLFGGYRAVEVGPTEFSAPSYDAGGTTSPCAVRSRRRANFAPFPVGRARGPEVTIGARQGTRAQLLQRREMEVELLGAEVDSDNGLPKNSTSLSRRFASLSSGVWSRTSCMEIPSSSCWTASMALRATDDRSPITDLLYDGSSRRLVPRRPSEMKTCRNSVAVRCRRSGRTFNCPLYCRQFRL